MQMRRHRQDKIIICFLSSQSQTLNHLVEILKLLLTHLKICNVYVCLILLFGDVHFLVIIFFVIVFQAFTPSEQ